jgi:tetratricopeptide (TPR) repeat protein
MKQAVELDPKNASVHQWYSLCLAFRGQVNEGLAEMERAHELDPLSLVISTDVGFNLIFVKQYAGAAEQFRKTLELDQNFALAAAGLCEAEALNGTNADALEACARARTIARDDPFVLGNLGYAYARCGRKDDAAAAINALRKIGEKGSPVSYFIAYIQQGLGEREKAFEWLEKAYRERDVYMRSLRADPIWDDIRSDPRYLKFVEGMTAGG